MELDKNGNKLGLRNREDFYKDPKLIHAGCHLLLFSNGELLLQKRRKDKRWEPGVYSYSVSETLEDESFEECIIRGAKEELKIDVEVEFLFMYRIYTDQYRAFHPVFVSFYEEREKIKPDLGEIEELKWTKVEDINTDSKEYANGFIRGIKILKNCYYKNGKLILE